MKKRILLLLLLPVVLTLCACSAEQTDVAEKELSEAEAAQSAEELGEIAAAFTKTIHDFEGCEVYNLDESEDNNFVVWQKGVTDITLSDSVNVIEETDEESLTYRFQNADETLKALKKGDVFYGMSADGATAVAGKVKSIRVDGDTVQIEGAELELGDLYEYVDIDMGVGVENVTVGELPEGVTAEYVTGETSAANASAAEEAPYRLTTLGAQQPEPASNLGVGGQVSLNPGLKFTVSLSGHVGDASLGGSAVNPGETDTNVKGAITLTGKYTYTLCGVDAAFHFMDDEALFYAGAQVRSNSSLGLNLTGSGTVSITQFIAPEINIPVPGFPLLKIGGKLSLMASASGSIRGGITGSLDSTDGYQVGLTAEDGFFCGRIEDRGDPVVEMNVEELSGTVLIGPVFETNLGLWGTAKAYGETFAGLEFKGSYDPFETTFTPEEAVHDCDVCIDGSIDFLGRVRVGAKTELPGLKQKGYYWTLPELRHDFKDFYVSFGREGINEPEFGWDKCPYKRFRTDITVLNEGEAAGNAKVKAESADGRSFEETTDENGYAKLYLPVGDNVVTASSRGAKGTANAPIKDSPASVTINLTDERQIFIVCEYAYWNYAVSDDPVWEGVDRWPFITERWRQAFPDAVFIPWEEWASNFSEDGSIAGLEEAYGVSPGDIVVTLFSGLHHFPAGSWAFVNGEQYFYQPSSPEYLWQDVGMVVLPMEEDVESGVRQDEPFIIGFGVHWADLHTSNDMMIFDPGENDYRTRIYLEISEVIGRGFEFDEDFRMKKMGDSEQNSYYEDLWRGTMLTWDYAMQMDTYTDMMAEYIIPKAVETVEKLWNNEWEEDGSGDIVVSETP